MTHLCIKVHLCQDVHKYKQQTAAMFANE